MEELLLGYRNILLKQYTRSHPKCYHINKSIEILYKNTEKRWKCPSIHHKLRRPLSYSEKEEIVRLAYEIRKIGTDNVYLLYYIKKL